MLFLQNHFGSWGLQNNFIKNTEKHVQFSLFCKCFKYKSLIYKQENLF